MPEINIEPYKKSTVEKLKYGKGWKRRSKLWKRNQNIDHDLKIEAEEEVMGSCIRMAMVMPVATRCLISMESRLKI
jgi:hypothetical protein